MKLGFWVALVLTLFWGGMALLGRQTAVPERFAPLPTPQADLHFGSAFSEMRLNNDGSLLLCFSAYDQKGELVDVSRRKTVFRWQSALVNAAFANNGRTLYLSSERGGDSLWDLTRPSAPRLLWNHRAAPPLAARFMGEELVVLRENALERFNFVGNRVSKTVLPEAPFLSGAISRDGQWLALSSTKGAGVRVVAADNGKSVFRLPLPTAGAWGYGTKRWIQGLEFSPDGKQLAGLGLVCSSDSCYITHRDVLLWEWRAQKRIGPSDTNVRFHPIWTRDSKAILRADGTFVDAFSTQCYGTFHSQPKWSAGFENDAFITAISGDGRVIAGADDERNVWFARVRNQ